jgi:hypothetical protein
MMFNRSVQLLAGTANIALANIAFADIALANIAFAHTACPF